MTTGLLQLKDGSLVPSQVAELVDRRFPPLFNGDPCTFDAAVDIAHGGEEAYDGYCQDSRTITSLRAWELIPTEGGMTEDVAAIIRLMVPDPDSTTRPAIRLAELVVGTPIVV